MHPKRSDVPMSVQTSLLLRLPLNRFRLSLSSPCREIKRRRQRTSRRRRGRRRTERSPRCLSDKVRHLHVWTRHRKRRVCDHILVLVRDEHAWGLVCYINRTITWIIKRQTSHIEHRIYWITNNELYQKKRITKRIRSPLFMMFKFIEAHQRNGICNRYINHNHAWLGNICVIIWKKRLRTDSTNLWHVNGRNETKRNENSNSSEAVRPSLGGSS